MWAASVREHIESKGEGFFDYEHTWLPARSAAIQAYHKACDKNRRKSGDREIMKKLEELEGKERDGGYKITPARRKVITALVNMASESSRLFCSYLTLAKAAGVSARTSCTVRAELEEIGILERVRTGGKAANGLCHSNKYTVKWNALRDVLGIPNRWDSRYHIHTGNTFAHTFPIGKHTVTAHYSTEGFTHHSRGKKEVTSYRQKGENLRFPTVENHPVINISNDHQWKNMPSEQGFCAVTELITLKKPSGDQPESSPLSLQDINHGETGHKQVLTAILKSVNPALLKRLAKASERRMAIILNELEAYLQLTPRYASLSFMAEDYLTPILMTEKL